MNDPGITVKVKKLHADATIPHRAKPGDVAFDLYSVEDYLLGPESRESVNTGIAIQIPEGYEG
ncbi:MAG: deoxyuridine 5'-triphosphate nucleotidohydrolase, partial [Candidatus Thorarchaeota archaeon]|nr:deoxyuridine 5'-triphosphate nucleotidohydrolase [Candidatus Thorarchaeota archaeon]